jgi:histidine triad (HIT) family protein
MSPRAPYQPGCLFCKIVAGEIPSRRAFEDEDYLVFHDIAPWAPVHVLMIPKVHITTLYDIESRDAPLFGRMLAKAPALMTELGVTNGFRTLINTGRDGLQEVQHVHIHVMGGPRPWAKG